MHDAFEHEPILEKLPLQIECIATYGKCYPDSLYIKLIEFPLYPGILGTDEQFLFMRSFPMTGLIRPRAKVMAQAKI